MYLQFAGLIREIEQTHANCSMAYKCSNLCDSWACRLIISCFKVSLSLADTSPLLATASFSFRNKEICSKLSANCCLKRVTSEVTAIKNWNLSRYIIKQSSLKIQVKLLGSFEILHKVLESSKSFSCDLSVLESSSVAFKVACNFRNSFFSSSVLARSS